MREYRKGKLVRLEHEGPRWLRLYIEDMSTGDTYSKAVDNSELGNHVLSHFDLSWELVERGARHPIGRACEIVLEDGALRYINHVSEGYKPLGGVHVDQDAKAARMAEREAKRTALFGPEEEDDGRMTLTVPMKAALTAVACLSDEEWAFLVSHRIAK